MPPGAPAALAAGAAFTAAVTAGVWAVRGRSSAVFAPSIWRGPASRKAVALTFDDGPSPSTARLLDLLATYAVKATFFQIGANAQTHPDLARATADAGHEIGN